MSETNKDKDASLFTLKAVIDSAFEKLLNEDDDFMLNCSSFPDPQVVRKLLSQSVSKQEEQALTDQQQSGHEQKDLHYPGAQLQGLKTKSLSRKTKREYSARKPFLEAVAARTVKIAEISKKALAQCGVNNNKHSTRKPGEQEPEDALATLSIDDISLDPSLPVPVRYREFALWHYVSEFNSHTAKAMQQAETAGEPFHDTVDEVQPVCTDKTHVARTFKSLYVSDMTDAFAQDLETLRNLEAPFDEEKMAALVDCFDAGLEVFDDIEKELEVASLERKGKRKQKKQKGQ